MAALDQQPAAIDDKLHGLAGLSHVRYPSQRAPGDGLGWARREPADVGLKLMGFATKAEGEAGDLQPLSGAIRHPLP